MRAVGWLVCGSVCLGSCAVAVAADAGNGLTVRGWASPLALSGDVVSSSLAASSFRSRLSLGFNAPAVGLTPAAVPPALISARLLGDYYFSGRLSADGRASGFRATSGVLFGSRLGAWGGTPSAALGAASVSVERRSFGLLPGALDAGRDERAAAAVPYVGIGYSSDALDSHGRWGISADLGLMALRQSDAVRLGRALDGARGTDDALRELRLTPMLQLGVSYSF